MAVKVIKNKVYDGTKTHNVGDIVKGLSEEDESQLILAEVAERFIELPEAEQSKSDNGDSKTGEPSAEGLNKDEQEKQTEEELPEAEQEKIDPDSLALNTAEYVKSSVAEEKNKK